MEVINAYIDREDQGKIDCIPSNKWKSVWNYKSEEYSSKTEIGKITFGDVVIKFHILIKK